MAMLGSGANLPAQKLQKIRSLLDKIRGGIQAVPSSCFQSEINSSENSEYVKMTSIIALPQPPVLEALSESVTWLLPQATLRNISTGLQQYQALLTNISALHPKCQELALQHDIRDLDDHISDILQIVGGQAAEEPKLTKLNMQGKYYVQISAQLTLLSLDKFLQNVQELMGLAEDR